MVRNLKREYTLPEVFSVLMKHFWVIVLCAIIGASGAFLISTYIIDEQYTASVSMYVAPNRGKVDIVTSLSDLYYAQQVAQTYVEILKTNSFMESVASASGLSYSVSDLEQMVEIEVVKDTEIIQVRATSTNPLDSLGIANVISLLAPQKISDIQDADSMKVVDKATLPKAPVSPNVKINTIIGFFLGGALTIIIIFIRDMLDQRIKDEDDIVKFYNIPILGTVPRFKS